jgi:glyoxylase I family protein
MTIGTKNKLIQGCGLHHAPIQVRDWEATIRLYRDVLGMEVVNEFVGATSKRKIALLDIGDGNFIELFAPAAHTPAPGSPAANDPIDHIGLATSDTRAAIEQVRQAGYEVTAEPRTVNVGHIRATVAFFRGPNGEIIEFFQTYRETE